MCSPISVIFEYVVRNRFLFLAEKELLLHQRIFLAYCVNDHLSSQSNVQLKHTTDELVKKKKKSNVYRNLVNLRGQCTWNSIFCKYFEKSKRATLKCKGESSKVLAFYDILLKLSKPARIYRPFRIINDNKLVWITWYIIISEII